jgi:ABC-type Fe3+ transport system permease subunit
MSVFEEDVMEDKIKAAVSQLNLAKAPKKGPWQRLMDGLWALIVFCFIAFGLGVTVGFGVLGYQVITTWQK